MKTWILAAVLLGVSGAAFAADVVGEWAATDGRSKMRFTLCGSAVCGALSWVKPGGDGRAKVGDKIFFDMKPNGEGIWTGRAFNPDDGKEYAGKMTLQGDELTTAGCALGGFICKSYQWMRVR